jgi:hypothetical protein
MSLFLMSFPQAIIKQTTAPTNVNAGTLWWDTDDLLLYYYTGTSWLQISSSSNNAGYESMIAQISLEILRLSAEGTLTAPDYDNMFVDYFSDADGQDGTIDTGNTTAQFSTDSYKNGGSLDEAHGNALGSASTYTNKAGVKITPSVNVTLTQVTKNSNVDATTCYLMDSSESVIDSQTFTGNNATFSQSLTASTKYIIAVDKGGASYNNYRGGVDDFPKTKTNFEYTYGYEQGLASNGDYNWYNEITSIETEAVPSDKIIQTNAQALEFAPAYIFIHSKDKTLAGTGSITYDVSFDGGSTWDSTDNALDSKIAVTDGSSKNMIIKLNLNGTGSGNTASCKDYEVVLWSS